MNGYRDYYSKWDSNKKDNLESITLTVKVPRSANYGYIVLEYYFANKKEVEDLQDKVF